MSTPKSILRAERRWLSSVVLLLDRPDRYSVVLERYKELGPRMQRIQLAYEKILDTETDEAVLNQIELDFDQSQEIANRISYHAGKLAHSPEKVERSESCTRRGDLLARLPAIALPTFSGDLDEWPSFLDLFDSLVHARDDLSPALKLAQLRSALHGEPRELVSHLTVSEENYDTARALLISRYHNVRRLADTLLGKIWAIPKVARVKDIRVRVLNPVLTATKALQKLGLPVDHWSYLLVNYILQRLPTEVQARFEFVHGGNSAQHLPEFKDLVDFLETECRRADTPELVVTSDRTPLAPRGKTSAVKRFSVAAQVPTRCLYCRSTGHRVTACDRFQDHRVQGRRDIAKQRNWCFICLDPHFARDCPRSRGCSQCGGKHHPILCMNRSGGNSPSPASRGPRTDIRPLASSTARERSQGQIGYPGDSPERAPEGGPRGPQGNYAAVTQRTSPGARPVQRTQGQEPQAVDGYFVPVDATGGCSPPRWVDSPPLLERPRRDRRPPRFVSRSWGNPAPVVTPPRRRTYQPEWDPLVGLERPNQAESDALRYSQC